MLRYLLLPLLASLPVANVIAEPPEFDVLERSVPELQTAMASGRTTSANLVRLYLDRIAAFDQSGPGLNAMLYINPRALEDAAALDRERADTGARGPLHGIPVVLKDNFDTADMPTTAGSVAMTGFVPPDDAYQVRKLRDAGAVFIGKTNLHEFARGIETVSSLGGYTRNPYDPRRNPGGSSGGTAAAVAASFAAVGMGSDTCGSIRVPAASNNLFGLRVTQGLSSRDGIVPLSHTQDVAGPLARSMIDLVTILDVTVGEDPSDRQTSGAADHVPPTFHDFLQADALDGARLGLLTEYLDTAAPYGEVTKVVRAAIARMSAVGAEIVDVEIEGLDELLRRSSVIDYEFATDVEAYLQASGAPLSSIPELLESGMFHSALEERYRRSVARAANTEEHRERLARRSEIRRRLIAAIRDNDLDALVYPALRVKPVFIGAPQYGSLCRLAAHSGLPALAVPAGFTRDGVPVGVELLAEPFADGRLIALGYAWEQVAQPRRVPARTPSLVSGTLSYDFVIRASGIRGRLRLDRPSQVLDYELEAAGIVVDDIVDLKLHRGSDKGPAIQLFGPQLAGSVPISNEALEQLVTEQLYVVVYTKQAPRGHARGRIERR